MEESILGAGLEEKLKEMDVDRTILFLRHLDDLAPRGEDNPRVELAAGIAFEEIADKGDPNQRRIANKAFDVYKEGGSPLKDNTLNIYMLQGTMETGRNRYLRKAVNKGEIKVSNSTLSTLSLRDERYS